MNPFKQSGWILFALLLGGPLCLRGASGRDWPSYLGDEERSHYSDLSQINAGNVAKLTMAWCYRPSLSSQAEHGKPAAELLTQIETNPLIVNGVFYGLTASQLLVALDAATGGEVWRFDVRTMGFPQIVDPRIRGISYWAEGGDRRILFTHGHFLFAIDAGTGRPVKSFGRDGVVDFRTVIDSYRDSNQLPLDSGTPGTVFENLFILPLRTSETMGSAPCPIIAFDIRTGRLVWSFHTIPRPGEFGYETWPPDAWKNFGGTNCWAGMALDRERGLLLVPTGSSAYDFWGGNRKGEDLFSNCLICLDVRTGRRIWHYQIVHHDLWDRDLPSPPTLLTVRRDGQDVPAVAQLTKSGHVFVFRRDTGEPLFPIEERPVPPSDLAGESAWPTQPLPLKPAPICRQTITYDDLTTLTPAAHRSALDRFARLRQSIIYQPGSREGTIVSPGQDGGAEWGGAAADPKGILYVNASNTACILTMAETTMKGNLSRRDLGRGNYIQLCAGCHSIDRSGNRLQNIPPLIGVNSRLKRSDVLTLITKGRGVMPPYGFLPEATRESLADYVLTADGGTTQTASQRQTPGGSAASTGLSSNVPYGHNFGRWLDPEGYPAVKPPWGTLNAIDLNTGEYLWKVPLGEFPELTARGIPPTGTDNYGGPVVTAGGLVFIAATCDDMIRAFDKNTGRILWQAKLPTSGYATPATYLAGDRQYVVIACGGGKLGSKSDDAYVAFSLPK